jgi:hypothetical protein
LPSNPIDNGRVVDVGGLDVEVAVLDAAVDAGLVAIHTDRHPVVHRHGQRLRAAHAAQSGGEGDGACQRAAELLLRDRTEGLVGALQDALRADVDPRARRHLPVHHQALGLELAELLPIRPVANEIGVRDQHARRPFVGAEHTDWLAGLHQHGLVVLQPAQRPHDRVERLPAAGGAAGAAVDHQVFGMLGDLGVEIVHQHPQRGLLLPALASQLGAAGGPNEARGGRHVALFPLVKLGVGTRTPH